MNLRDLLMSLPSVAEVYTELPPHPSLDMDVKGLSTNSHACQPGDLFIGMPGTRVDGGEFWPSAIAAGAIAALVSSESASKTKDLPKYAETCLISMPDMPTVCAEAAAAFYQHPARDLKLVGVTGTNGKTTTTHLIEFLFNRASDEQKDVQNPATALFGTLYTRWPGFSQTALHTTPFAVDLQRQLSQAVQAGAQFGVMEVSSHALAQKRVLGCAFDVAVFTNLTQDHLDFHKDLDDYFAAKALMFGTDYLTGRAVVNLDDPYGQQLLTQCRESTTASDRPWSYSAAGNTEADFFTRDLTYQSNGVRGWLCTPEGDAEFFSPLVGQFNLANLLAAIATGLHLGLPLDSMVKALPDFTGVPGRVERVQVSETQDISVMVDYAHTPDSLENLLKAARPFVTGNMICVFGCGGDRDRTKRPKMGAIAARLADQVIVTSDNPRTEDPQKILDDVVAGIPQELNPTVIGDRAIAIRTAILNARSGDSILIAGKGHEDYQILGTEKIHFDDREQARESLHARYANVSTPKAT